jgi:hypothetical protein
VITYINHCSYTVHQKARARSSCTHTWYPTKPLSQPVAIVHHGPIMSQIHAKPSTELTTQGAPQELRIQFPPYLLPLALCGVSESTTGLENPTQLVHLPPGTDHPASVGSTRTMLSDFPPFPLTSRGVVSLFRLSTKLWNQSMRSSKILGPSKLFVLCEWNPATWVFVPTIVQ